MAGTSTCDLEACERIVQRAEVVHLKALHPQADVSQDPRHAGNLAMLGAYINTLS